MVSGKPDEIKNEMFAEAHKVKGDFIQKVKG